MRVLASGTIFDSANAPKSQRSNAFTSLTGLANGRFLAAFRSAPGRDDPGGRLKIMGSKDGREWVTIHPGLTHSIDGITGDMYAGYFTELEPGWLFGGFLWVDRSNPDLSFVHPETAGILPTKTLVADSSDGGVSWHDWREVDISPQTGCSITGPIFTINADTLELPYETWKSYDDPSPGNHTASLRLSHDGGHTWPERQIVAADPGGEVFFWDQRIARHPETGALVAMFWTHDRGIGADIENHIAWSEPSAGCWSTPVPCGWQGQHCQPLALGGDRLAAIYVHRHHPASMCIALSNDFGQSWEIKEELTFYEHQSRDAAGDDQSKGFEEFWQEMMTWQFGHPRGVLTDDGEVLIAWYAGEGDVTSMRWSLIEV